jgi:hypothetical protein
VPSKPNDLRQAADPLSVELPQAYGVVSSNGEIAVIRDSPLIVYFDAPTPSDAAEPWPGAGSPAGKAAMWVLSLVEAGLLVAGLAVLVSCRFVDDAVAATHRSYLGMGLLFAGAFLAVPAIALIAERAGQGSGRAQKGRHRRPRHAQTNR